jgi:hypothetical protein
MLLCYIRSGSDWASVFYTNSQFDPIAPASMITQIRVETSSGQNTYNIASFPAGRQQILNLGGVTMYAEVVGVCFDLDMQFNPGAIIDALGGGIALMLKKIIAQAGFWTSGNGSGVNGFSMAGSNFNITRADLEAAASTAMDSPAWNKVVFPGSDFAILDSTEFPEFPCRTPVLPGWDPQARRHPDPCTYTDDCLAAGGQFAGYDCECWSHTCGYEEDGSPICLYGIAAYSCYPPESLGCPYSYVSQGIEDDSCCDWLRGT